MVGERDVLAEVLHDVQDPQFEDVSLEQKRLAAALIPALAARGWRLVPSAPPPESLFAASEALKASRPEPLPREALDRALEPYRDVIDGGIHVDDPADIPAFIDRIRGALSPDRLTPS